jgi:hypothetical protein
MIVDLWARGPERSLGSDNDALVRRDKPLHAEGQFMRFPWRCQQHLAHPSLDIASFETLWRSDGSPSPRDDAEKLLLMRVKVRRGGGIVNVRFVGWV